MRPQTALWTLQSTVDWSLAGLGAPPAVSFVTRNSLRLRAEFSETETWVQLSLTRVFVMSHTSALISSNYVLISLISLMEDDIPSLLCTAIYSCVWAFQFPGLGSSRLPRIQSSGLQSSWPLSSEGRLLINDDFLVGSCVNPTGPDFRVYCYIPSSFWSQDVM